MLPVSVSCPVGQDGGGSTMLTEQKLEGKQCSHCRAGDLKAL